jgi:hypothetical protein
MDEQVMIENHAPVHSPDSLQQAGDLPSIEDAVLWRQQEAARAEPA